MKYSPNVDKPSMIRWKQAKLHQDRRDTKDLIAILQIEIALLYKLKQSASLIQTYPQFTAFVALADAVYGELDQTIIKVRSFQREARWGQMEPIATMDNRLTVAFFIRDTAKTTTNATFQQAVPTIITQIQSRCDQIKTQVIQLQEEQNSKITSDNIFTEGFNKTIVPHASKPSQNTLNTTNTTDTTKIIETIHTPAPSSSTSPPTEILEDPLLAHFATLDLTNSAQYLHAYPQLITSDNSDLVLAQAFDYCQHKQYNKAKKCVAQGLVLSYCKVLSPRTFFSKIHIKLTIDTFEKDIQETYGRIKARVQVLAEEEKVKQDQENSEAQERLLRSTMPDGSYKLQDPNEERCTVFNTLCKTLQKGLLLGDVDIINEGLKEQGDENTVAECVRVGLFEMEPSDE